jgi:hypothetical protein
MFSNLSDMGKKKELVQEGVVIPAHNPPRPAPKPPKKRSSDSGS